MASGRDAKGRPYSVRTLSAAVEDLPGDHVSVSHASINKLSNGSQDNPTIATVLALAEALGDVPPAHLLPHGPYSDVTALRAFEDPRARHVLALLSGLPEESMDEVVAQLERKRAELGLDPVQPFREPVEELPPRQHKPKDPPKRGRGRRRSEEEIAQYGADSLEGF
ncbi:hypothetical protein [Streptomyces sp. cg35]|uniref:hypothetical protein n=1 Tax=Streptomyces sp. cg35 TaxID=3421650 RepID=UPI003D16A9DD